MNVQNDRQLQSYKFLKSDEAKSIVADYERTSEMLKDISKQYDDISRMNLNEKYKDYAKLKSDEFVKRAEAVNIRKGNAQAFAEIDDAKTMLAKFAENNTKSDKFFIVMGIFLMFTLDGTTQRIFDSSTGGAVAIAILIFATFLTPILLIICKRIFLSVLKMQTGKTAWIYALVSSILIVIVSLGVPILLGYFTFR